MNGLARAALVHLWFESIHPFEDGNGRLGRVLADMALAPDMHAQDRRPTRRWCVCTAWPARC
ncbi:MAG: Fic family protein [Rhodoferax sp.]|nr:Fic family protein [Rhodoferax sp.]